VAAEANAPGSILARKVKWPLTLFRRATLEPAGAEGDAAGQGGGRGSSQLRALQSDVVLEEAGSPAAWSAVCRMRRPWGLCEKSAVPWMDTQHMASEASSDRQHPGWGRL